jgi:hypothetical protein
MIFRLLQVLLETAFQPGVRRLFHTPPGDRLQATS